MAEISSEEIALLELHGFTFDPLKRYDTIIGQMDPFIGGLQQTHRMRAYCTVQVNGINITDKLLPHLISVRVIDSTPTTLAEIEIDDRDGKMPLPPLNAPVIIALGWKSESMLAVFNGVIDDFEHGFGRKQGGRRMYVHASGLSHVNTTAKQPMQDAMGEGAPPGKNEGNLLGMPSWIQQMAKNAGVNANVMGLGEIKQDYWAQAGSSLQHEIQSLSEKFGFTYQFSEGNKLTVTKKGHRGVCCYATWRDNLIAWRVRPFVARSSFKGSVQQWFDPKNSNWNTALQQFGLKFPFNSGASNDAPQKPAETETNAGNVGAGQQEKSEIQQGNGRIVINGEPAAVWDGFVLLTGARPGVDGLYLIDQVEHVYSRQGFITTLEVQAYANAPSSVNVGSAYEDLPKPAPNQG
jgi:Bacteriophage probable baseplate hub protein